MEMKQDLKKAKQEIEETLSRRIIPFWLAKSIDNQYGGYLTAFDENGNPDSSDEKYIVTQSRMVWGFSYLRRFADPKTSRQLKRQQNRDFVF